MAASTKKKEQDLYAFMYLQRLEYLARESLLAQQPRPEEENAFSYTIVDAVADGNERHWTILVERRIDNLIAAKLTYSMTCRCERKPESEDVFEAPFKDAIQRIAERSSYVLSALTYDSFMQPLITPPFFDEDA